MCLVWNQYDFRPKLHDPKFNCYFITFFLKSHNLIALIQVFKDIFYWLSKKVQFVNLCMIWDQIQLHSVQLYPRERLRPEVQPLTLTLTLLYTIFFLEKAPLSYTFLRRLMKKSLKKSSCHFFHVARNKLKWNTYAWSVFIQGPF